MKVRELTYQFLVSHTNLDARCCSNAKQETSVTTALQIVVIREVTFEIRSDGMLTELSIIKQTTGSCINDNETPRTCTETTYLVSFGLTNVHRSISNYQRTALILHTLLIEY
jgi:hypothetical protein